jgi:hypothetical protein
MFIALNTGDEFTGRRVRCIYKRGKIMKLMGNYVTVRIYPFRAYVEFSLALEKMTVQGILGVSPTVL